MEDKKYIDGFFCKKPSEKAPQFIKSKVSIKKDKFINWLNEQDSEWVNIDILESQKGEFYGKVDDWKPTQDKAQQQEDNQAKLNQHPTLNSEGKVEYPQEDIDAENIPF